MTVNMHTEEQHAVTVGGTIEVLIGNADNGTQGVDRGFASRINVNYDKTTDSGLQIAGRIAYYVGNRADPETIDLVCSQDDVDDAVAGCSMVGDRPNSRDTVGTAIQGAPDVLFLSVGGGFGTVSVGAHAQATCAILPRPIAFNQTVNWIYHFQFSGLHVFPAQEEQYCGTPESVSYAIPSMGGLNAMISYAPDWSVNQWTDIEDAAGDAVDVIAAAATWSSSMGGADITLGVGINTSSGPSPQDSQIVSGTIGMAGATVGASAVSKGDSDGYTVAAKYAVGALTPAVSYSDEEDASAMVIGASYAVGGGLNTFLEYTQLEDGDDDDSLLLLGFVLNF